MKAALLALSSMLLFVMQWQTIKAQEQIWDKIIPLTDDNFVTTLDEDSIWLVVFYVPWDEHIKPFAPKLEMSYADLLKRGYTVKFGAVNVAENRQLGWKYQIDRSPLVKILMYDDSTGDWKVTNYDGEREPMPVCEACIDRHRVKNIPYTPLPADHTDGDIIELDDINFKEIVFGSNQVWQIAFTAPWCYHCKLMHPAFEAAAKDFGGEVRFATINADKNRRLARKFNI